MKMMISIILILSSMSICASLPEKVNCDNGNGLSIEIKLSSAANLAVPVYRVEILKNGKQYKKFSGLLVDSNTGIMIEAKIDNDKVYTAGYDFNNGMAFFQETANSGMSPLPPTFFKENCSVE